ncbi:MAG: class I SAM-dependent methyltransferase [Gammaproteobacteria bacterium]|jgi:2-polyprenyl-3-methyl-5-hydroxy-6-metoxy-1,4-benzoquinol methylase
MTDLFQEKAQDWDVNDMVKALSMGIGSAILDNVILNESMQVMDFGAGTGLITAQVANEVGKVTAVDVSQAMLDKLAAKEELRGKVEIVCQNIIEQPIGTEFDLIVSAMAMHHVEDTDKMIQRFAEHLKPGARVALADLDEEDGSFHPEDVQGVYHSGFNREVFMDKLEAHGFKDIRFVTAHTASKEEKSYPIFLALASKA